MLKILTPLHRTSSLTSEQQSLSLTCHISVTEPKGQLSVIPTLHEPRKSQTAPLKSHTVGKVGSHISFLPLGSAASPHLALARSGRSPSRDVSLPATHPKCKASLCAPHHVISSKQQCWHLPKAAQSQVAVPEVSAGICPLAGGLQAHTGRPLTPPNSWVSLTNTRYRAAKVMTSTAREAKTTAQGITDWLTLLLPQPPSPGAGLVLCCPRTQTDGAFLGQGSSFSRCLNSAWHSEAPRGPGTGPAALPGSPSRRQPRASLLRYEQTSDKHKNY